MATVELKNVKGGELWIENVIPLEEKEIEMTFARSIVIVSTMQSGNPGNIGLAVNALINLTRRPDRNYNWRWLIQSHTTI